ncbi:Hypothetical protein GbCGDNIH6_0880 [Granulibacter bethesdensis]|nr:Hypothetical protein GbCGDNIH6_0880 [Granulibacter bethesdensis]
MTRHMFYSFRSLHFVWAIGLFSLPVAALLSPAQAAENDQSFWPSGARPYIISPANGAVVSSPFTVVTGLKGLGIAPAGDDQPRTGHHHLLIDTPAPQGEALEESIPKDAHHVHLGGGQTQVDIKLPPGKHTLQLIMGDAGHVPHSHPLLSDPVTITVK